VLDLVRKNGTKPVEPNVRYDDKHGLWRNRHVSHPQELFTCVSARGALPTNQRRGRDAQLKLDFLLKAMNRSALLCRSHPSRQGHSASLQHAYLPNVGTHHFTVDLRGPSS